MLDNPSDTTVLEIASSNYIYFGWVVRDQQEFSAFVRAVSEGDIDRGDKRCQVRVKGRTLYRLCTGVENRMSDQHEMRDIDRRRAGIPIFFENQIGEKPPSPMNVLYLDGHIEIIPFGTRFPATQAFFDTFAKLISTKK